MEMIKRNLNSISVLLILLLLAASAPVPNASAAAHKNFLWKVRSKTATVYLLGSIHYLTKEAYPLNKAIEDSFTKSNVLAVEANVNNPDLLFFTKFIESAFYPGDETLEKNVSPQTYELVRQKFGGFGLPIEFLNKERPWFLALTLESLELLKLGFDPTYGIDMHFLAKAASRRVVELESLDYQVDLLSHFSPQEEEAFLRYTIKDLQMLEEQSGTLLRLWKAGDAAGLESMMSKSVAAEPGMTGVYNKILYDRNRSMASKIEGFLGAKETYFVVVGAAHLVGEKGIVELLRRKGYTVEQM